MKAVAVVSGGMDSVTLLHFLAATYADVTVVSFDYGQRHVRELDMAKVQAGRLNLKHKIVRLPLNGLLPGSSLTDAAVPTPHGHYSEETMRKTVVPGRNAMMLSTAWGIAAATGASAVGTAVHAGDHFIYPDCRPRFINRLESALRMGTQGHADENLHLEVPFLYWTKVEILRLGMALRIDYSMTWTCYEGGTRACGNCGACQERLTAFAEVGLKDPLDYVDRDLIRQTA